MVVPVKPSPKAWIFLKPFTLGMWLATAAVLVYTMFIVWFVEHRSNPDFSGPWNDQLGNALWFTFSSLFLAHNIPKRFFISSQCLGSHSPTLREWDSEKARREVVNSQQSVFKILSEYDTELYEEENVDSLSLQSFWGLFLFSISTSSVCFLLFLGHLCRNYCRHHSSQVAPNVNAGNESVSVKTVRVARYLMNAKIRSSWRSPSSGRAVPETEMT
ncbi:hypothetical protein RHMOL_Rhmol13G0243400 [Rhododendron molle]|uniref:Uncharacterized protein n=1 Tax=Rhododendron molle TaxID=49168 RepID=A0ACC0LA09_RHOML|nr:hypothetical protein RHMOL_Rhmol13G0243400 [Rhododendron molle]